MGATKVGTKGNKPIINSRNNTQEDIGYKDQVV